MEQLSVGCPAPKWYISKTTPTEAQEPQAEVKVEESGHYTDGVSTTRLSKQDQESFNNSWLI